MNALAKPILSLLAVALAVVAVPPSLCRGAPIDEAVSRLPRFVEMAIVDRKTAKSWTITDWAGTPSSRRCTGGDRPLWDDMVGQWYEAITDRGTWIDRGEFRMCASGHCGEYYDPDGAEVDLFGSSFFRSGMFADADVVDWGEDYLALDTSDAAMIGWHGNRFLIDGILTCAGDMAYHRPERECYVLGTEMQLGAYMAADRGQRPRVLYVPAVLVNVKTGVTPFPITAAVARGKT